MLFAEMCATDRHSLLRFVFPVSVSKPSLENSENLNSFTPDENEEKKKIQLCDI